MLEAFLAAFVTFFVVIDPPGVAPMFATLTQNTSREWQRKMAFKSVGVATIVLLGFAFGGEWLLGKLHVSLDAFRIAGGVLLFLIAVDMLFEKRTERREERNEKVLAEAKKHPERFEDVSVFPLAIPLISGPGSIASIMLFWWYGKLVKSDVSSTKPSKSDFIIFSFCSIGYNVIDLLPLCLNISLIWSLLSNNQSVGDAQLPCPEPCTGVVVEL